MLLLMLFLSTSAWSAPVTTIDLKERKEKEERSFYTVLDSVLEDFVKDLKSGTVYGLKDIAIRKVTLSENIPPTFSSHLELVVTERILKTTKARVLQCPSCRDRGAVNNPVELTRAAKMAKVSNILDLAFTYQSAGIVLSMFITDPETGSVLWSRSYLSEVPHNEYQSSTRYTYGLSKQYRLGVAYFMEPNVGTQSSCMALVFRLIERYDDHRKEVGFEVNYLKDVSTLFSSTASTAGSNLYSGLNLTLLFIHSWGMQGWSGGEEDFDRTRANLLFGIGGTYASGFLGPLVRGGYEWRIGRRYTVSTSLGYRPSSTGTAGTISGAELGLGLALFL